MKSSRMKQVLTVLIAIIALNLGGCSTQETSAPEPAVSPESPTEAETPPEKTPEPQKEEPGLNETEVTALRAALQKVTALQITPENAEAVAKALEKEIEADLAEAP
jgi:hypothetical protein